MSDLHEAYLAMVNEKNLFPAAESSLPPVAGNLAGVELETVPPAILPARARDLSGKIFGKWRVQRYVGPQRGKTNRSYWECVCSCGTVKHVLAATLVHGKSKSCGCNLTDCGLDSSSAGSVIPDWMQKPGETFGNVRERFRRDLADILAGKKL